MKVELAKSLILKMEEAKSSILQTEAARSSETLVSYHITTQ